MGKFCAVIFWKMKYFKKYLKKKLFIEKKAILCREFFKTVKTEKLSFQFYMFGSQCFIWKMNAKKGFLKNYI